MGTRSLTFVHDEPGSDPVICIYQQYDGYFSGGVGDDILSFLKGTEIVNGFGGGDTSRQFNGAGDLAARLVTHFKEGDENRIGNVYIQSPVDPYDQGIAYHIYCTVGQEPYLMASEYGRTVEGPVSQIVWPQEDDD